MGRLSNWEKSKEYINRRAREAMMMRRRMKAAAAVANAIKYGWLPHPSYLKCSDCDNDAQCYDHRDYRKPLDVWPVCFRCDAERGAGEPYDGMRQDWHQRMLITKKRLEKLEVEWQRAQQIGSK